MSEILDGLEGVVNQTDDTVVYGATKAEHDQRLAAVLRRLEDAGVTLNREKCHFSTTTLKFLGHIIGPEGIRPDPNKVKAIGYSLYVSTHKHYRSPSLFGYD